LESHIKRTQVSRMGREERKKKAIKEKREIYEHTVQN
jgi:hypothetical protein